MDLIPLGLGQTMADWWGAITPNIVIELVHPVRSLFIYLLIGAGALYLFSSIEPGSKEERAFAELKSIVEPSRVELGAKK